jgi:hypothetical protein
MGEPDPTVRVPDSALSDVLGMTCNDAVNGGPRIADLTGLERLPNLAQLDLTATGSPTSPRWPACPSCSGWT